MLNLLVKEAPFSLDHHCYSEVPGKIDRKIYQSLLNQGISSQTWVVHAQFDELRGFHKWDDKYTRECLTRLRKRDLIIGVCKTKKGWIFLAPRLKDFVQEPQNRGRGFADGVRLSNKAAKNVVQSRA